MRLEAQKLACGYPGRTVCRDIDLSVGEGKVLCLLGPNGSGKTTLFRTLLGLLAAHGGKVVLGGEDLSRLTRRDVARQVAYVPQAHSGVFPYLVLDIVMMGRTAHLGPFAQPGARDRQAALAALDRLGIADLAPREYTRLSGGQRQLVLVARALAQHAPVIVMDEPTASLDFGNQVRVLAEIAGLSREGLAIVLSTHAPDQAFAVADEVALLDDGRLIAHGAPREVLSAERLGDVYGVKVAVEELGGGQAVCVPDYRAALTRSPGSLRSP